MGRAHLAAALAASTLLACGGTAATEPQDFMVEGRVALASLVAVGDGHLQEVANLFSVLAAGDAARTAEWERVRDPLAAVSRVAVPGLYWFALPDGSYWAVGQGRAAANLSDRAYWPRLMAGQTVIGHLVASRATGKSAAIVAVPVRGSDGTVVGVLGSSLYLDSLSLRIKREIALQPNQIFFSVDATPIGALQDDPEQIFLDPYALGEPELERAVREMLANEAGVVNYRFRGKRRTVLYQRSAVSGWWYAFGRVWD